MKLRVGTFLMAVAAMLTLSFTACSGDMEESGIDIDNGKYGNDEKPANDEICCSFNLLNEKGEVSASFKKGDNIIFDFEIINNCSTPMICTLEQWNDRVAKRKGSENGADMLFSKEEPFLSIYNEKGECIGVPYSGMFCDYSMQCWLPIDAHTTRHVLCPWRIDWSNPVWSVTYPVCGVDEKEDLPVGKYRVTFKIMYRKKANETKSQFQTVIFNYPFEIV